MSHNNEPVLTVVGRIYDAVENPERWPETFAAIGSLIGGRPDFWNAAQDNQPLEANPHALEAGCHGTFFLSRSDLQAVDEYAQEFGQLITRFLKIVFLSILWSPKDFRAREAIGLRMTRRYLQAFEPLLENSPSNSARVAARKFITALWEDGRMFRSENLESMRVLAPHLDRAVRLQTSLNAADLRSDMVSGALDCLTLGVILVDRGGLPLWHNRRAQEIMGRSNALRLSSAGLTGRTSGDTRTLRDMIKGAMASGTQGLVTLNRDPEVRPLLLIAIPLKPIRTSDASDTHQLAYGVVFMSDPDITDTPTIESLRRSFDLTHREAELAIAVARGHGLKMAAKAMGVAITTARTQLQHAFEKTGTSHQAELAALVHQTLTRIRHN
jgi:DNA-binding CsgD family transcriptional regulator